jgi:hypothetical protein
MIVSYQLCLFLLLFISSSFIEFGKGTTDYTSAEDFLDLLRSLSLFMKSPESSFSFRGSKSSSIRSQGAGAGWFSATSFSQSSCGNGDVIESSGVVTGQCLYSPSVDISFLVFCNNGLAFLNRYSGSGSCTGSPLKSSQIALDHCVSTSAINSKNKTVLSNTFQCSSNGLSLPLGNTFVLYM